MRARVYQPGERYGRLTVIAERRPPEPKVRCRCDCGTEVAVRCTVLGRTTNSCGCIRRETTASLKARHGMAGTPIYGIWADMVARCTRDTHPRWTSYGGRGITVCDRWRDFTHFYADMGERPEGRSLDRIDNDGPYDPTNCRWATPSEQAKNRRPEAYAGVTNDPVTGRFVARSKA